jgi:prepilin-type N-terminal cleavage/methylation domain-containing protein
MRIVSHARADQRGFTLAELLVAIAVVGLIMTGLLTFMMSGNQTYLTGSNQIEAQQAARVALARMVREIRGAGYNPTGAPACPPAISCPIVGAPGFGNPANTALMIQNDLDGDGTFEEQIAYTLNGTDLQRQGQTIVGGIQALAFTYLDENGVELVPAQPQNIRSVQIVLTTQPENQPATWQTGRVSVTMSDQVRLRNR